jgi:putative ABC transport system permease protein
MARSAFAKEVTRSVTGSLGRFLALLAIVALGCGFYAGLRMTCPDMKIAVDRYLDGTNFMDVRVVSTMGLSDADLDALRQVDGVDGVMGARETDVLGQLGDGQYTVRVHELPAAAARSACADGFTVTSDAADYENRLILAEGRWPTSPDECVVSSDRVLNSPVQIGDDVEVIGGDDTLDDTLIERSFTVVGIVHAPYYISSGSMGTSSIGSGMVEEFIYVPRDAFAADLPYTEAFLTVRGAKELPCTGDAYEQLVSDAEERLRALAPTREQARRGELVADAQAQVDDAQRELDDRRAQTDDQLADAQTQLDDAAQQLAESEQELASGEDQYASGVRELADQRAAAASQLADARAQLEAGEASYADGTAQLQAAQDQLSEQETLWQQARDALASQASDDDIAAAREAAPQLEKAAADVQAQLADPALAPEMRAALEQQLAALQTQLAPMQQLVSAADQIERSRTQLDEAQGQIGSQMQQLQASRAQLDDGWAQYASQEEQASDQLADAQTQLDVSHAQLDAGASQLEQGRADYEAGVAALEDNRRSATEQLVDAQAQIDDAQQQIDQVEAPSWLVMGREKNIGYLSFTSDADRVDRIASIFPFIFFLVAALVALTTMTRMVDEERGLVGMHKALGYANARIASKYCLYALAASGVGAACGIAVLAKALPAIIMKAYAIIYYVPGAVYPYDVPLTALSAGLGVGITLVATAAASYATLREKPCELMRPRAPKPGKRILLERVTPLWTRLSFTWKVTFRNLFRYKRRFFMTVIGIAGCTALLLTGWGLHDSINDIIDVQYGELVHYDAVVSLDDDLSADDAQAVDKALASDAVGATTRAYVTTMLAERPDGGNARASVVVPQDGDEFGRLWTMRTRVGHDPIVLGDDAVVIDEKLANTLGVGVGDEIELAEQDRLGDATETAYRFTVTGVMENYIYDYVFVGKDAYRAATGTDPRPSTVYASVTEDEHARNALTERLQNIAGVRTVAYNDEVIDSYRTMLRSVDMIVVVLVVSAAALAYIVLYNLTNINIEERLREIATLKVLGFTRRETTAYVYREIILLALIGAAVGLVLGTYLEGFVVVSAEVDQVMFGRSIHAASFAISFVLTMAFCLLALVGMRGKLARIDMVESLKSNE